MIGDVGPGNLSLEEVVDAHSLHELLWRLYKPLEEGSIGRLREKFAWLSFSISL